MRASYRPPDTLTQTEAAAESLRNRTRKRKRMTEQKPKTRRRRPLITLKKEACGSSKYTGGCARDSGIDDTQKSGILSTKSCSFLETELSEAF